MGDTENEQDQPAKYERPLDLLGRLKIGREEFCQRLLTTLILEAPYPKWNTRSRPAGSGLEFLRDLYQQSFDGDWPGDDAVFVDEFEPAPRHDAEAGGAPDYAVIWDDRLWLIELKTERASHRRGQIPGYFELAHHHFAAAAIDLLYVTPPMEAQHVPAAPWARYAHTTWGDLSGLIRSHWSADTEPGQQEVVDGLLDAIANLHLKPSEWRALVRSQPPAVRELATSDAVAEVPVLDQALEAARLTAEDGQQRAVEFLADDLEDLLGLRLSIRNMLAATPDQSALRHFVPWIWRWESLGKPLTQSGAELGMELRLSRYREAQS